MADLYFNELSSDYTISQQPGSEEETKELLFLFIKTCFSFILSGGTIGDVYLLSRTTPLSLVILYRNFKILQLINELFDKGRIDEIEAKRFKAFINETFTEDWAPEYRFNGNVAYGMGEAHNKDSYSISFSTKMNSGHWDHSQFSLLKISADQPDRNVFTRNLTTPRHVIVKYKIWQSCDFTNKKPQAALLPNISLSHFVLNAYEIVDWQDFYGKYLKREIARTLVLKIAKILAIVNGWNYLGKKQDNQWSYRDTFQAKTFYLQVDTEQAAFEVYNGTNNHIGELRFDTSILNESKVDKNRFIRI